MRSIVGKHQGNHLYFALTRPVICCAKLAICPRNDREFDVSKKRRGPESKYTDSFKRQLVAESSVVGATVPMVSKRHGVPTSRIYSWRGDARFQPTDVGTRDFTAVEVTDALVVVDIAPPRPDARIEITLENGRKLSISNGVDAGFVLELARGLAA